MATRSVVCPECGEGVPYGRLACPACGSLVATVAGAPHRDRALGTVAVREELSVLADEPDGHAAPDAVDPTVAIAVAAGAQPADAAAEAPTGRRSILRRRRTQRSPTADEPSLDVVAAQASPADDAPVPAAVAQLIGTAAAEPVAEAVVEAAPSNTPPAPPPRPRTVLEPGAIPPVLGDWPAPEREPEIDESAPLAAMVAAAEEPLPESAPDVVVADDESGPPSASSAPAEEPGATLPPPAGAYLPPSQALTPGFAPGATAGTLSNTQSNTQSSERSVPVEPPPVRPAARSDAAPGPAPRPTTGATPALRAGNAPLLADLPFDAPDTLPGWLVAAGSGLAALSFVLPWSNAMLGARGVGGYTDTWGLASSSHFLVLVVALGTLALAILPTRVAVWLRTGVLGLVLGGLVVGLAWPYLVGGLGGQVGVLGEAVGGVLLVAGGLLAVRPSRHAGDDRAV